MESNYETEIVNFGDLKPGDKIIGSDGNPVTVTAAYEKHLPKSMYEIEMEDGEVVQASGNHMWYCETNADLKEKEEYIRLAKEFFNSREIPPKFPEDEYFPLVDIVKLFGNEVKNMLFIEKAAKSLGYSSYTPHLIYTDKMKVADYKEAVMNYSYNDLIDFLHSMKSAIFENKGYFYFGEVRTTEKIFSLIENGEEVNIPHKEDVL